MSQQIYARIKRSSKYYGQTKPNELFRVRIVPCKFYEHVVHGNNNDYRLQDVNLFVVNDDGLELRIK